MSAHYLNTLREKIESNKEKKKALEARRDTLAAETPVSAGCVVSLILTAGGLVLLFFDWRFGLAAFAAGIIVMFLPNDKSQNGGTQSDLHAVSSELSKVESALNGATKTYEEQIKKADDSVELKKTCQRCGHVWYSSPNEISKVTGRGVVNVLVGLSTGDYAQTAGNQEKIEEQMVKLLKCPQCSSRKHDEEWVD